MSKLLTQIKESKWVFGAKDDLYVFGGSTLLALIVGSFVNSFGDYLWWYILIDQPHVYTTYFYTYTSDRFTKQFKYLLILLPLSILGLSYTVVIFFSPFLLQMILANYSIFHFMKQQTAWFLISSGKEPPQKRWAKSIDKFVLYASILSPVLLSLTTFHGKDGWRDPGDLITVPQWVEWPIYILWPTSWLLYIGLQIKKYVATKKISWGKNFHLINAMLIWTIYRLEPFPKASIYGLLLLVFGHSIPYIFLGERYMRARRHQGEKFHPHFKSVRFILPMLIITTIFLSYGEVYVRGLFYNSQLVRCILLTFVFTHFTLDSLIWRKSVHPEGLSFLRESKT